MSSWKYISIFLLAALTSCSVDSRQTQRSRAGEKANLLEVASVWVQDKPLPISQSGKVNLGAFPANIVFHFKATTNLARMPIRLTYQLEGYENVPHQGDCEMDMVVRFYNDAADQVSETLFPAHGDSAGWNGSLTNSQLVHRRETVIVPPHASKVMIVMTSAGPPATEGVFVVANLVLSKIERGPSAPVPLIEATFDQGPDNNDLVRPPRGWMRDGIHASMAKIVKIGADPTTRAFAILDDDPIGHAEWRTTVTGAPTVKPGDNLAIEWNEMYSMGVADLHTATYDSLPEGNYVFRVRELNIWGQPTGLEASLNVVVPAPLWKTSWFWTIIAVGISIAIVGTGRYLTWHKMQREMLSLKSQQALECERLRIARDIHDDLGARVTQISLLSAMLGDNLGFPDKARSEFHRISGMCRDLVSALYETVWTVNPENDNLDALVTYLCQIVNQLCERSQISCRYYVSDLPRYVQVSSQVRHNISMAVKEAVHNIIKHSGAGEIVIQVEFAAETLSISVRDNGRGFQPSDKPAGHGLVNMKRRLEDIGGNCSVESQAGKGTTIRMRLAIITNDSMTGPAPGVRS